MQLFGSSNTLLETISIAAQTAPYIDFISDANLAGITSIVLTDSNQDYFLLDDLQYVRASADVPEPSSMLLLGLAGFVAARKRKK
jgi:PEP-CTERM motif